MKQHQASQNTLQTYSVYKPHFYLFLVCITSTSYLLVPFNFMFALNLAVIYFPNIDSLWQAVKCEILIVCWGPSPGPRGKRCRCRSGSVRFSVPGVRIDQDRTVNSGACGHIRQPFTLLPSAHTAWLLKRLSLPLSLLPLRMLRWILIIERHGSPREKTRDHLKSRMEEGGNGICFCF